MSTLCTAVASPIQDSRPRRPKRRRNKSTATSSDSSPSPTTPPPTRFKRLAIEDRVFVFRGAARQARNITLDITPAKPFNFLGLPKEVRLMIYELLPQKVTHKFVIDDCIIEVSDKCSSPSILSTCKTIYNESHQLLFNMLRHNGPRLHISFHGLNVSHVLQICDLLQPSQPPGSRHFRDSDDTIGQRLLSKAPPFDVSLFELRSYMRTPKDYEAHIDWIPCRYSGMTDREFLSRFVWDLGRLYCIIANHDYTVSVCDGDVMVPLEDFLSQRIPQREFGCEFARKCAIDGFVVWRDIICRPAGRRATSYWLWKSG